MNYNDLDFPRSGVLYPQNLSYYSIINDAWLPVVEIDNTGQSILMRTVYPDGDMTTLLVTRFYQDDMQFKQTSK